MKLLMSLVFLVMLSGCSSNKNKNSVLAIEDVTTSSVLMKQYLIGVDDRVEVNVWKNPDLTVTVPVRPDGKISVPLIGEVIAGGKTPLSVAENIKARLSKYIKDPQVSVILVDLRSHEFLSRVRVTGAVQNAVSIQYRQGMTILDIVLEAGGMDEFASGNSAKLFRKTNAGVKTIKIYLFDILNDGDMATNLTLQPGDILSIPERVF